MVRVLLCAALIGALTSASASAQIITTDNDSAGIQVSPVIDAFDAVPGQTIKRTLEVTNIVPRDLVLYPQAVNFHTDNEEGRPVFFTPNERFSKFAISDWINFAGETLELARGERKRFVYTITVPADAPAGGRYGAILFATKKPEIDATGNIVGLIGMIGSLTLINIPGEVLTQLIIEEFRAPTFLLRPPADFSLLLNNIGGTHVKPSGGLTIRNLFGRRTAFLEINKKESYVLPESKRRFDSEWRFDWKTVGRYSATATVSYANGKTVSDVRTFYVIPVWLIIVLILLLLALINHLVRKRRRSQILPPNVLPPLPRKRIIQ